MSLIRNADNIDEQKELLLNFNLLGLHTVNALLLFSSFDSTVNNICLRYQPNFTNTFQLHMYDLVIRFTHIKVKLYNNIRSISAKDNFS